VYGKGNGQVVGGTVMSEKNVWEGKGLDEHAARELYLTIALGNALGTTLGRMR